METFDSTKKRLTNILQDIKEGKIQLPDFQRGWVWDDNRIKGLIASVIKSFPISVVTLLETGNENLCFKTKPIQGASVREGVKPDYLILDGQQRLTSLYQSIVTNQVVMTKNEKGYTIKRWYYIDMQKAMDSGRDLEEAIFSINENKIVTRNIGREIVLDLSSEEKEFANLMYPVCMMDEYSEWRYKFEKYWNYDSDKIRFLSQFERDIVNNFSVYDVPVIIMKKENRKEAVCQVFEKVNTGGVSLTVFELLTATFAASGFNLIKDWNDIRECFSSYKVLKDTSNTDVIQAVTLLSTYKKRIAAARNEESQDRLPAVSAKRKSMLDLDVKDYESNRDDIVNGFIDASKLLTENHIYTSRDLPYTTQLIPLSAIIAVLGNEYNTITCRKKLMKWFWCGVFGELYGSANETRYALDILQVVDWIIADSSEPSTVYDAVFSMSRLYTLRTRNSAAYKGIYALLIGENAKDWLSGKKMDMSTYFNENIDIHHIFPKYWCQKNNLPREDYDCIVNKTPLSQGTNIFIGGEAPSRYLKRLENRAQVSSEDIDLLLISHQANPEAMRIDDFYTFMAKRKEKILLLIESAMGKTIARDLSITEEGSYSESSLLDDNDE